MTGLLARLGFVFGTVPFILVFGPLEWGMLFAVIGTSIWSYLMGRIEEASGGADGTP